MDKRIKSLKTTIRLLNERRDLLAQHCRADGHLSFHAGVSRPQLDYGSIKSLEGAYGHLAAAIRLCEEAFYAAEAINLNVLKEASTD